MEVVTGPSKNSVIPHDTQNCPLLARVQALCTYFPIQKPNLLTTRLYVSHMKLENLNPKGTIEDSLFRKLIPKKWKK